jgi:hypothetical protein
MDVDAFTLEGGGGALFSCEESMPIAGPILPQAEPWGKKCLPLSTQPSTARPDANSASRRP